MDIEWDDKKNLANFKKHGVWFEEAATVIQHSLSRDFVDPDHHERTLCIGRSHKLRLLFVVYVEKKASYRMISAREATNQERTDYEESI